MVRRGRDEEVIMRMMRDERTDYSLPPSQLFIFSFPNNELMYSGVFRVRAASSTSYTRVGKRKFCLTNSWRIEEVVMNVSRSSEGNYFTRFNVFYRGAHNIDQTLVNYIPASKKGRRWESEVPRGTARLCLVTFIRIADDFISKLVSARWQNPRSFDTAFTSQSF